MYYVLQAIKPRKQYKFVYAVINARLFCYAKLYKIFLAIEKCHQSVLLMFPFSFGCSTNANMHVNLSCQIIGLIRYDLHGARSLTIVISLENMLFMVMLRDRRQKRNIFAIPAWAKKIRSIRLNTDFVR